MGCHPLPSSITCHLGDGSRHHCSHVFLFAGTLPSPSHSLTVRPCFFFLSEGFHRISSETIDLDSWPDPESPRHLSCPATQGWFYSDWEANQMQDEKLWLLNAGSQRAPPATPFWILDSFHSWMHSTLPHVEPFTDPTVKTFTWHKWCLPGQPSLSLATPWLTSMANVI